MTGDYFLVEINNFAGIIKIQKTIQKMYSPHSYGHTHTNSIATSIINPSTPSHSRTSSANRNFQLPVNYTPRSRVPSQKKLSITCQTSGGMRNYVAEDESGLKKQRMEGSEMKQKFMSLQTSFIAQSNIEKRDVQRNQMTNFKLQMQQKLQGLTNVYIRTLKQLSLNIQELQAKLEQNQLELRKKSNLIEVLQKACNQYKMKLLQKSNLPEQPQRQLLPRIEDLQTKIRILTHHYEQINDQQYEKYDTLRDSIISYFGNKLQTLKKKSDAFINKGLLQLSHIESKVQIQQKEGKNRKSLQEFKGRIEPKMDGDKQSQRTQSSTESIGESSIINQQHEQGISFWDDCFFDPSQRSENCELILEMAKRRGEALHCWLDQSSFLRYYQSNSFIYNRRGDRIKLTKQELSQLLEQNLLII